MKMDLKKVLHISYGIFGAWLVLILLGAVLKSILAMVFGLGVAVAYIVFIMAKWRCPYCGEHLGRAGGKYCPHCGHHLEDLEEKEV